MTLAKLAVQLKYRARQKPHRSLPALWLFSDSIRLPDPREIIKHLPRGSGFVFRHYGVPNREKRARDLRQLCRQHHIIFLLAGDWRMALRLRADGVHLPEALGHQAHAIRKLNPRALVTIAAHSARAVWRAYGFAADAIFLSPVFATPSHPERTPLGAVRFARLVRLTQIPVVALGGVNAHTARRLKGSAAAGVASVSGLAKGYKKTAPG